MFLLRAIQLWHAPLLLVSTLDDSRSSATLSLHLLLMSITIIIIVTISLSLYVCMCLSLSLYIYIHIIHTLLLLSLSSSQRWPDDRIRFEVTPAARRRDISYYEYSNIIIVDIGILIL